ncbi:PIN-like domain-containing protein [Bacillus pumilus]|uniref:PIN-like domain-containing protein n=1 Tax=Bacillus pumilus TaxID=1408 RepID=UPI003212EBB9
MDEWKYHLYQPETVSEWLNEAIIVIDTNVLLAAYQWRKITVNEVLQALEGIKKEGRLRIPLQVIKEFSENRPKQITQRMHDIDQIISKHQADKKPIIERLPMLQTKDDSTLAVETLREKYNEALRNYKDELMALRNELKKLFIKDPFLDKVIKISEGSVISSNKKMDDLLQEASKRFKDKIPPGYKDNTKESNSSGDFLIWSAILEIDKDVVFVSGDIKDDWVYSDKNGGSIVARRELIQEFYKKNGKRFAHITPRELIDYINPTVSDTVREDLERYETSERQSFYLKFQQMYKMIQYLLEKLCVQNDVGYDRNFEFEYVNQKLYRLKIIPEQICNDIDLITQIKNNDFDLHERTDYKSFYFLAKEIRDALYLLVFNPRTKD